MKRPQEKTTGHGSVSAQEVLTLREFGRRLGLAKQALCDAQRDGLKTALVGRVKFVVGSDAVKWFRCQAEQQAGDLAEQQAGDLAEQQAGDQGGRAE